jgi:hypothetical protein
MRTTLTLDDDLAAKLRQRARERDVPFKQVVNDALRAGLASKAPAAKRYRMKPRELRVRADVDLTRALGLASELEDAELVRKLEQGR